LAMVWASFVKRLAGGYVETVFTLWDQYLAPVFGAVMAHS